MPHDEFKCAVAIAALQNESRDLRAKLAEREAQIVALRQVVQDFVTYAHRGNVSISGLVFEEANHVLADTAHDARAFVERLRAETREECAQAVERGCDAEAAGRLMGHHWKMAAAIRALPPRRGT